MKARPQRGELRSIPVQGSLGPESEGLVSSAIETYFPLLEGDSSGLQGLLDSPDQQLKRGFSCLVLGFYLEIFGFSRGHHQSRKEKFIKTVCLCTFIHRITCITIFFVCV